MGTLPESLIKHITTQDGRTILGYVLMLQAKRGKCIAIP